MKNTLLSKFFAFVAAFMCVLGARADGEYDFVYMNIRYAITSANTVEVVAPNVSSPSGFWSIPDKVTRNDGTTYRVTSIGNRAFLECVGITSMKIGNNVTSIGEYAFSDCSGLTSLTLPNSLETIEGGAFLKCAGLTSVTIPNSVTYVGGLAFYCCSSMTTLVIGENCKFRTSYSSATNIFKGCTNLTSITCLSPQASSFNESLFEQTTYDNAILKVPKSSTSSYQSTNYWNKFANIEELPFSFMSEGIYYSITGSNTVEVTYGDKDYNSYSGSVNIPETVTHDGTTYTVTAIGSNAFRKCSDLTGVSIPKTVTKIGYFGFYDCTKLTSVIIPNSVKNLGHDAFARTGLKSVSIPNTVTYMGSECFYYCSQLSQITLSNAITQIDMRNFQGCTSLTQITIPSSVKTIAVDAFKGCTALTNVTCQSVSPCTHKDRAFDNSTYTSATLWVPAGSKTAYQNASGWQNFNTIKETAIGLIIAGIQVTADNLNSLTESIAELSDEAMYRFLEGDMEVTYDVSSQTLTLKNAFIHTSEGNYGLQAQIPDLKIKLIGKNTIISDNAIGVRITDGPVTFYGRGSLEIKSSKIGLRTYADIILKDGVNITAESLSNASGFQGWTTSAINQLPTLTMSGAGTVLLAKGGSDGSVTSLHALNLRDGIQIMQPAGATFVEDIGIIKNNVYVANEWVMICSQDYIDGISPTPAASRIGGETFNLAGQKVDGKYKGIVIKDGKKVLVK